MDNNTNMNEILLMDGMSMGNILIEDMMNPGWSKRSDEEVQEVVINWFLSDQNQIEILRTPKQHKKISIGGNLPGKSSNKPRDFVAAAERFERY